MHHWGCTGRAQSKSTAWSWLLPLPVLSLSLCDSTDSPASFSAPCARRGAAVFLCSPSRLQRFFSLPPENCGAQSFCEGFWSCPEIFPGLIQAITRSWGLVQPLWSHSIISMPHQLPLPALLPLSGSSSLQTLLGEPGCRELGLTGGFGFILTLHLCSCPGFAHPGLLSVLPTFLLNASGCTSWCPSPLAGCSVTRNHHSCDSGTSVGRGGQGQSHSCP